MRDGFIKVAAGTPELRVADVSFNKNAILSVIDNAQNQGIKLLCLPELCLTGYTCGDLFLQETLTDAAMTALEDILEKTRSTDMLFALGIPFKYGAKLYNCAAFCCRGELLALVPKSCLPNHGEFCEGRWFSAPSGGDSPVFLEPKETFVRDAKMLPQTRKIAFGTGFVLRCSGFPGLCVGAEISADLCSPMPPSAKLALSGATVIFNLSASAEAAARAAYRRELVKTQSARLICGYIYAGAGEGESTTDMVFGGHGIIAEGGALLAENRFHTGLVVSELDIARLVCERQRISVYPSRETPDAVSFELELSETTLTREISPTPFVPRDAAARRERCEEIIKIAALGLKKRISHIGIKTLVVGVSGGLDSTLALLISARALDMLGFSRSDLLAVTMPGFGTTSRTRGSAEGLAAALGAELRVIPIEAAVRQHFADIGHDERDTDTVFENAQARERTQILMDIANGCDGLVVGTGDMSELALGWTTYNGDHMSMYGVNAGIPKTLLRHLVAYFADTSGNDALSRVLRDILATPVSPELLPAENGEISQKTEDLIGPYELHDFFLYHMFRRGAPPKKVLRMAEIAFSGAYDRDAILKWEKTVIRRFFSQQFKRSCLPDAPMVGTVSLSPRGGWHMPSDAVARLWLDELEGL